jgi:hypothetical protein
VGGVVSLSLSKTFPLPRGHRVESYGLLNNFCQLSTRGGATWYPTTGPCGTISLAQVMTHVIYPLGHLYDTSYTQSTSSSVYGHATQAVRPCHVSCMDYKINNFFTCLEKCTEQYLTHSMSIQTRLNYVWFMETRPTHMSILNRF